MCRKYTIQANIGHRKGPNSALLTNMCGVKEVTYPNKINLNKPYFKPYTNILAYNLGPNRKRKDGSEAIPH